MPKRHRLALLWLDWSGARVASIDKTLVGDYDQTNRRVRLRKATTKTRRPLWIDLPPVLADAIEQRFRIRASAILPRDCSRTAERTRSGPRSRKRVRRQASQSSRPHDLRHRRISLLHLRGTPWARIAEFVGQRKLSVTADTYSHVMLDEMEVDYAELLAET